MKRIGRAPATVATASALSLLLAGCATDVGGSPQPSATATVNACAPPGSHPTFIAILLQGISSGVSSSGSFNPATTSFCASPDGQMPPDNPQVAIQTLANGWLNWGYNPNTDQNDAKNPSTVGAGKNLIDALAHAGGYVLPFSYLGAMMTGSQSSPSFTLTPYNADDVGARDPTTTEPSILQREIASIHKVFKHTKIIVIGHSNGGLIAEQWWLQDGSANPEGVIHVFSLDSPVNGVSDSFFCVPLGCTSAVGPLPGSAYTSLWAHQSVDDTAALKLDNADHLFTPVGSYGDPLYDAADPAALNVPIGIASQLFHSPCAPALQSCDPTVPPDFIDPCATKYEAEDRFYSPPAYGILLHGILWMHSIVKNCSGVIEEIIKYVSSVVPSAVPSNRAPTPNSPPTPGSRACAVNTPSMFSPLCPDGPEDTHFTPWQVVYFYYAYVHARDYSDAWALMSPGWQATQGGYEHWKAGYAGANNVHVSEVSQHGDIVNVIVTRPGKCFDGAYQVDRNKITTGRLSGCARPSSSPSATSTTPPATVVKKFDPWGAARQNGAAAPAPGLVVTNGGTATCDSGSSDDPGSALAVRCNPPGNGMPCFINDTGGGDPGSPLLCSGDPTSGQVIKVTPAGPTGIPVGMLNQANPSAPAWFLILADGRKCAFQGYGTNTNVLSYGCGGSMGATVPDRSQPVWTVQEGTLQANPTPSATHVAVVTAYY